MKREVPERELWVLPTMLETLKAKLSRARKHLGSLTLLPYGPLCLGLTSKKMDMTCGIYRTKQKKGQPKALWPAISPFNCGS